MIHLVPACHDMVVIDLAPNRRYNVGCASSWRLPFQTVEILRRTMIAAKDVHDDGSSSNHNISFYPAVADKATLVATVWAQSRRSHVRCVNELLRAAQTLKALSWIMLQCSQSL